MMRFAALLLMSVVISATTESHAQRRGPADIARSLAQASERVRARQDGLVLGTEIGSAVLTAVAEGSSRSFTFNYGFYGGYRYHDWGFLLVVENALWRTAGVDGNANRENVVNIGIGLDRFHRSGFLRTQIRIGASILVLANELDPVGTTGFFVDIRPLGFHWLFRPHWALVADLLHLALVAPVLQGVPLVDFQFRTSIGIEAVF